MEMLVFLAGDFLYDYHKVMIEIQEAAWDALRPHYLRGGLFLTAPELDLDEVARVVAQDQKTQVERWLSQGKIEKVLKPMADEWDYRGPLLFAFVIVQPYVFAQLKRLDS